MRDLMEQMLIKVNENIYLKDPNSSSLGKRIVKQSIFLINEMGLEAFTFRKLAKHLNTTESSIYRYFENKNMLLIYLTSWYWGWLEYQLVFSITNIGSPEKKLKAAIMLLTENVRPDMYFNDINLEALSQLIITESSKVYMVKDVDESNKVGFYSGFQRLVNRMSEIIREINKSFSYPNTLALTIIDGALHQKYFANHIPSLTDIKHNSSHLAKFYTELALAGLKEN